MSAVTLMPVVIIIYSSKAENDFIFKSVANRLKMYDNDCAKENQHDKTLQQKHNEKKPNKC